MSGCSGRVIAALVILPDLRPGRPKMSGYSYSNRVPGDTGVATPLSERSTLAQRQAVMRRPGYFAPARSFDAEAHSVITVK